MSRIKEGILRGWRSIPLIVLAICLSMGFVLIGCSGGTQVDTKATTENKAEQASTFTFTDSAGREVEVPKEVTLIAPSGHTAQQVILTMAPDKIVGLSQELTESQLKYFGDKFATYPVFGAAFGAKGDMNKEAVAASGAQIVIDTGEFKEGLKEDLDNLQIQLGIPVVFIETPLDDYGKAYEMLGEVLGMQSRGKELGDYCTKAYAEVEKAMATVSADERLNVAYLLGTSGLNAIAKGSYQGSVIDMCANNVVVLEKASGSGAGNEISLEQIAAWNPELVVFGDGSIYDAVGSDAAWGGISAIETKTYYEVPAEPWTWLNNPPTVNQILGMQWFARLCYPDKFDNDMQEVVTGYYETFYGYDLSQAEYADLMKKAIRK